MKLRILLLGIFVCSLASLSAQKTNEEKSAYQIKPEHIGHHDHDHDHSGCMLFINELRGNYQKFYNLDKAKGTEKMGNGTPAVFDIEYFGFTPEAENALNYAFDIISTLITSPVPIEVSAEYAELGDGSLAGARFENFAVIDGNFYPSSVINKIAGVDVQFGAPQGQVPVDEDILIQINRNADWHFDPTDATNIGDKYDLTTVMLHEIIHGLGFSGGVFQSSDDSFVLVRSNTSGSVFAYDDFIRNGGVDGQTIPEIEAASQSDFASAIRNDDLFFVSPSVPAGIRIHAPLIWAPGTSFYHLSEETPLVDDLMTPFAARGVVNQDPGVATQMLYDMGWDNTSLIYAAEEFYTEDLTADFVFHPEVFTDSGIDTSSFMLVYSQDSFVNDVRRLPVVFNEQTGQWDATLPASGSEELYQYKLEVVQNRGNILRENPPSFLILESYSYAFITDEVAPTITHTDISSINSSDVSVGVKAVIVDSYVDETSSVLNSTAPLDTAYIEYRINDGAITTAGMTVGNDGFSEFRLGTAAITQNISSADEFQYRIIARDASAAANTSMYPSDGSFVIVPVVDVLDPVEDYINDFEDLQNDDFSMDRFQIGFVTGFESPVLMNQDHTYRTAGIGNTLNFSATLKAPIIIAADSASAFIKFKEIVLVEPGQPGTSFGDTEFWDYVIIEAKKLSGGDWEPIVDGYDSNQQAAWRTTYNSQFQFNNSTALPNPNIYRSKEISFLGGDSPFVAGDTVLVRFRLFSDPFTSGWGWMIENLNIQNPDVNVAVEDFIETNDFIVYPNPNSSGLLNISARFTKSSKNLRTELTDMYGRTIQLRQISDGSLDYYDELDISSLPAGIYFMTLRDNESAITQKVVKY